MNNPTSKLSVTLQTMRTIQLTLSDRWGLVMIPAGGCARNVNYGLEPKDVDVLVVGNFFNDSEAFELITELSANISRLGGSSRCYYAYEQGEAPMDSGRDFGQRLYACLKAEFPGCYQMDFLLQRATTVADAIGGFDCNLNQYVILTTPEGCAKSSLYVPTPVDFPEDELVWIKPVTGQRKAKMEAFYQQYVR